MQKRHYYKYTIFSRANVQELNHETGLYIYKVIALPMGFSNLNKQKDVFKQYTEWFNDFYIKKWDDKKNLDIAFNRDKLQITLPKTKINNIDKCTMVYNIEEEWLFKLFEQMISFFPPLYVGITNDIATRFLQHTNDTYGDTLISKINQHDEIKDNEILFLWQDLDTNFIERYLKLSTKEARDTLLEELETLFIQLNNPIFNTNKKGSNG